MKMSPGLAPLSVPQKNSKVEVPGFCTACQAQFHPICSSGRCPYGKSERDAYYAAQQPAQQGFIIGNVRL